MTEILLARHGQTDWNYTGRIQGHTDIPLNRDGMRQSQALAESLSGQHIEAVFCSELLRAVQTAQIISNRLGLPLIRDSRLREVNHGEWEGMLISDLRSKYAEAYAAFRGDKPCARAPGGETMREALARMESALDEAANQFPHGRILIVSHGLALALVRCRVERVPLSRSHQYGLDNCKVVPIHWDTRLKAGDSKE